MDADFEWPDEIFNEDGEADMDAIMEMLRKDPELLAQFSEMYDNDGVVISDYQGEEQGMMMPVTLSGLVDNCMLPTINSASGNITLLLAACFACHFISRQYEQLPRLVHLVHMLIGFSVVYIFFHENSSILVVYICLSGTMLYMNNLWHGHVGASLALLTLVYVISCEIFIPAEKWHNVRGAQMVLSMKVISLGFDMDNEDITEFLFFEFGSYLLHPCSAIFGPWISYQYYLDGLEYRKRCVDWKWLFAVIKSAVLSIACLLWSVCVISWLIPAPSSWGKWIDAYRDAQSFRFSHYFVCMLSELTLLLSGIAVYGPLGYMTSSITVSHPLAIELPRSLVNVVTSWNLPMHHWLKTYVFKLARPRWGTVAAVLMTYLASSLLHGINFQLAAVLLSLGVYSYIEHTLRKTLANGFSCCIKAKSCSEKCELHTYKWNHWSTLVLNLIFNLLAMFHLAYLGVMFDTTQDEQDKGYSMLHTLRKWSSLNYASHFTALGTYIFYRLIR